MSDENKITTNRIEEVLLQREKEKFVNEVIKAALNLAKVLNTFLPRTHNATEFEEFGKWVTSCFEVSYRVFVKDNHIEKLPAYIEKKLLDNAVEEFIRSVEDTKATLKSLDC